MKMLYSNTIILASSSPRRKMLLSESGFNVTLTKVDVNEDFSENLIGEQIPIYLANKKMNAFNGSLEENELLVTADTIVWHNNKAVNKPEDIVHAKEMLKSLSGNKHTVFTAVCVKHKNTIHSFCDSSCVYFRDLSEQQIDYYLTNHSPLDKAGAYGIQEFIGYVGIEKIEGCFYNVMGFPVSKFIDELTKLSWLQYI